MQQRSGDISFEFVSTILFGHQREDFVFSLSSDTLLEELGEIQLSDYLDQLRVLNKQIQNLDL